MINCNDVVQSLDAARIDHQNNCMHKLCCVSGHLADIADIASVDDVPRREARSHNVGMLDCISRGDRVSKVPVSYYVDATVFSYIAISA